MCHCDPRGPTPTASEALVETGGTRWGLGGWSISVNGDVTALDPCKRDLIYDLYWYRSAPGNPF
jgi:hypothetical protein